MQSPPGPETVIDGHRYLYFGGTGYLGLAGRPEVIEAACAATRRYGIHTATSRPGYGHNPLTIEVEARAAEFFDLEAAFYFATGYVSNHILLQAVVEPGDRLFLDEAAHYSLEEAARLTGATVKRFAHRRPEHLAEQLRCDQAKGRRAVVLTDGVFSTTGTVAPIRDYLEVLKPHAPAVLVVDDAHGLGVLGEHGRGTLEHWALWDRRINSPVGESGVSIFVTGTFSKAFGAFGGVIPGSAKFMELLRQRSHYYEGASAPPAAVAAAALKALEIVRREPELQQRLRSNAQQLRAGLRGLGLPVDDTPTAHVGVAIGDAANMQRIHESLKARGILVPYVAAYSGIGPEGLLRFAVCALHTSDMINRLLDELSRAL